MTHSMHNPSDKMWTIRCAEVLGGRGLVTAMIFPSFKKLQMAGHGGHRPMLGEPSWRVSGLALGKKDVFTLNIRTRSHSLLSAVDLDASIKTIPVKSVQ